MGGFAWGLVMGPVSPDAGHREYTGCTAEPGAPNASVLPALLFSIEGPAFPTLLLPAATGRDHFSGPGSFPLCVLPAGLLQGSGDSSVPHADAGSTRPEICISNQPPGHAPAVTCP